MIYIENKIEAQRVHIPRQGYDTPTSEKINEYRPQDVKKAVINGNGTYSIVPDDGFSDIKKVEVTVDVKATNAVLLPETKLAYSKWEEMPASYDLSNITDLSYMFYGCSNLKTVPKLNYSKTKTLENTFDRCKNITEIPMIDTSNVEDFSGAFSETGITTIPLINTSKGVNFEGMFANTYKMESMPLIDTSNGTDFGAMMTGTSIRKFPAINTGKGVKFNEMFDGCNKLEEFPALDTSNGEMFLYMYRNCEGLKGEVKPNLSNARNIFGMFQWCGNINGANLGPMPVCTVFSSAFFYCYKLDYVYGIEGPEITSVSNAFEGCSSLRNIPMISSRKIKTFYRMCKDCSWITGFPDIYTGAGTNFENMFDGCISLEALPEMDLSNAENATDMLKGCQRLFQCPGFTGLKTDLDISDTMLDPGHFIEKAAYITSGGPKTLTVNEEQYNEVSPETKALAQEKNWVIKTKVN